MSNMPDLYPVFMIALSDSSYSKLLAEISDPPSALYCRGNADLLNTTCLAVVGTRKITPYGKEVATSITRALVHQGVTIVSGLAMGIDAAAHTSALDSHGKTIAVLGSGIDDNAIYPAINILLAQRILKEGGLIISEYPPTTDARKHMFPERNRIISGLSLGVVVIEADEKSGALITARCALDQNRDVFAVPGSILSPRSAGPNRLIQQGAKVVLSAADIMSEYDAQLALFSSEKKNLSTQNPLEQKILGILESDGPSLLDEIIRKVDSETPTVIAALSMLEIHGSVQQLSTGKYTTCN